MAHGSIGILTGGGDCPGLNPAIKSATKKAIELGFSVLGIKEGWRGLLEKDLNPIKFLEANTRNIFRQKNKQTTINKNLTTFY